MAAFPTPAPASATLAAPQAGQSLVKEPENINARSNENNVFLDPSLKLPSEYADATKDADATEAAEGWLKQLSEAVEAQDTNAFKELFISDGWWRDRLTFTWSYRSLYGRDKIARVFEATKKRTAAKDFKLDTKLPPAVLTPYPDLAYVQAHFSFDSELSNNEGIVNIVLVDGAWKAWTLLTMVEDIKTHPEGAKRAFRKSSLIDFETEEPPVLIIGAGQSGLALAACLEAIGIPNVTIEKNERVGDTWRNRYQSLHLHSPVSTSHKGTVRTLFTYIAVVYLQRCIWSFRRPAYPQGRKVGNYLEAYADILHLNIWTSTAVENAQFDKNEKRWNVVVVRSDGSKKTFKPQFVVLATGLTGSVPYIPKEAPGQKEFKGKILHSTQYRSGKDFKGQNVVCVGTASTGFDIAGDLGRNGAQVTMLQRSPTYIMSLENGINLNGGALFFEGGPSLELADKLANALPFPMMKLFAQREVKRVAECDKKLLDGLNKAGFQTNLGLDDAGHLARQSLSWPGSQWRICTQTSLLQSCAEFVTKYFDTGSSEAACAQIIDGRMKVEQGVVKEFTAEEVVFSTGHQAKADAVIYCTGFQPIRTTFMKLFGDEVADAVQECWGLDDDPELKNVWKPTPYPQLYCFFSGFVMTRFNARILSRLLAARLDDKGDTEPCEV